MSDLYGGAGDQQQKRPKRPTREEAATSATPAPEPSSEAATDEAITALVATATGENAVAVFTDEQRFNDLYAKVATELRQHVPDLTTDKGRKAIAANAFRATKVKTSLDAAGKGLTEGWRKQTALVNAARSKMTTELDTLAKELRRPLTEWEDAEDARTEANRATVAEIRAATIVTEDDTSATVEARGRRIHEMEFPSPQWTEAEREIAEEHQADAVASLLASRARLAKQEHDARELDRLRAEAAERETREAAEKAEREAREAAEQAKREEQERREQAEAEEAERRRQIAQDAADAAREATEQAHKAEQDRKDREAEERLAEQRRIADDAAAEAQRLRDIETERKRVEEEEAAAARAREANKRHRQNIQTKMRNALLAIEGAELTIEQADAVVAALVEDRIPNSKVTF